MVSSSTLSYAQARAFYDRFGAQQDAQAYYEDPALDRLIARGRFGEAGSVFEFGCGTGRLAERLLRHHLPETAGYQAVDISPAMVELAARRLAPWRDRARVQSCDGSIRIPVAAASVERLVSTYVLDLLSRDDIDAFMAEADRVLAPSGRLCLVGLTPGTGILSRLVSGVWAGVHRFRPSWVGGCRPIRLAEHVAECGMELDHYSVVVAYGIASEVVVAVREAAS